MAKIKAYSIKDKKIGEVKAADQIFKAEKNDSLIHFVLKTMLLNKMSKTASAKGRSEVSGGGAKPFKQKGNGRARAGTNSSPLWRGGGVTFGPQNIKRKIKINKKVKRKALFASLTSKVDQTYVFQDCNEYQNSIKKVKDFVGILNELAISGQKILYVSKEMNAREQLLGNINKLKINSVFGLNIHDILNAQTIIIEEESLQQLEETYKNG
ncbi:MAG: 50S ribosomal protein L4 [Candidatus Margulisbacteria bacterium GWF2_35_9]|nr:ribosomal protein L4 [uncultured bacterium]OGI05899.1 MAG: 50S ribosomal protein L4 [Candidatus Margulisbacteria bacterium GWF2_35_9]